MAVTLLLQGRTKTFSKVPRFDLRHPKPSAKCLGSPCAIRDLRQSAEVRLAPFETFGKPPRKWLVRRPAGPDSSRQMEAPSPPQIRRRKARARAPAIWETRGHRREPGPRRPPGCGIRWLLLKRGLKTLLLAPPRGPHPQRPGAPAWPLHTRSSQASPRGVPTRPQRPAVRPTSAAARRASARCALLRPVPPRRPCAPRPRTQPCPAPPRRPPIPPHQVHSLKTHEHMFDSCYATSNDSSKKIRYPKRVARSRLFLPNGFHLLH